MKQIIQTVITTLSLLLALTPLIVSAQTGASYDLSHNVIAAGGSNSAGANFAVDGTAGQVVAGTTSVNGSFAVRGGFWAFQTLAPTAAQVSVSGRVLTADGQGIRNVSVRLTSAGGTIRFATTGTFGHFRFDEIEAGQIYILEISSKKFTFAEPTRILSVVDEIMNADFIAAEQ